MKLLVDIGNTRLKWGLSNRPAHASQALVRTADMSQQLELAWGHIPSPQWIVATNVAGMAAEQDLRQWAQRRWPAARVHFVVAAATGWGVKNSYREPARLGSDRWAALIGARSLTQAPVCVVDCGTAVTLDALNAAGEFVGGVIFPGIPLARQSLRIGAAGISETEGDDTSCFARTTADAVAAGTFYALVGAVERIVAELGTGLGKDTQVVLTGGDGPRLMHYLQGHVAYPLQSVPDLVLQGLGRIAESLA